nr:MAG TPA: hypothetical protein [Caudoviricetes sp.]
MSLWSNRIQQVSSALYGQSKHYHWEKQSALSISPRSYRIVSAWLITILFSTKKPLPHYCNKGLINIVIMSSAEPNGSGQFSSAV